MYVHDVNTYLQSSIHSIPLAKAHPRMIAEYQNSAYQVYRWLVVMHDREGQKKEDITSSKSSFYLKAYSRKGELENLRFYFEMQAIDANVATHMLRQQLTLLKSGLQQLTSYFVFRNMYGEKFPDIIEPWSQKAIIPDSIEVSHLLTRLANSVEAEWEEIIRCRDAESWLQKQRAQQYRAEIRQERKECLAVLGATSHKLINTRPFRDMPVEREEYINFVKTIGTVYPRANQLCGLKTTYADLQQALSMVQ